MAGSNAQPFEIVDFSGGITDELFEQSSRHFAELDNFLIGSDKKPKSRYGSEVDNEDFAEIPTGVRVSSLVNYANSDKLFYQSERSLFYRNPESFSTLLGPSGNEVFSSGSDSAVSSFTQWNRHLYVTNDEFCKPMKIYKDETNAYKVRNSSLPGLATDPVITAGAAGDLSFIYGFYYSYTYTVFGLSYESIGPVTLLTLTNSSDPVTGPITISNLPVIANGSEDNYDVATIKIKIFRTNADGTFLQQTGEVTNGTTVFVDNKSDDILQATGIPLYTNDGTVDYDPVPLHKFNHVVNNTAYYVHISDENGINPYKIRQSIPGIPDTAPIDFEAEVDDETTGTSSVQSSPIVFCKKYVFRIDQAFDQFGRGGMVPVRISDNAGCISHNGIVQAEGGIFWMGNDGAYYSDGYKVVKITDHFNARYKNILKNTTQKNRITGKFYEKERLIIWTIQQNSANQENDALLICDLKWGISERMTFTTWTGESFNPSSLEIFNNDIYRGDARGFVFRHSENLLSDPKINIYTAASNWVRETIIWKILSIHYNFGGTFFRKYPTRVLVTAANSGNTTIQINAINDDGKNTRNCKPIRVRKNFVWGDDDFVWEVSDFIWRGSGIIEQWRRFPKGGLRLSTLQLEITNGFSDITNSDTLGLATYSNVANTVTLNNAASKWPLNSEGYFIASESDGYVKEFLISSRVSDLQILINDPLNELPVGSLKWVIRGYKKDEPLNLIGFNINWTNVSQTQKTYSAAAAETGENA